MEHGFWHARWAEGRIGFHEGTANALLKRHLGALQLGSGQRVFLPLCGKTRDIGWLLEQRFRVAGAELSRTAVEQLFDELGQTPEITQAGPLERFAASGAEIFVGDIFDLEAAMLGPVDAVFDRAALVALPEDMRARYAAHLEALTRAAPQLLITFEYDQSALSGPPFNVSAEEVQRLYGDSLPPHLLERVEVPGGLKGRCTAQEAAWLLGG